VPTSAGSDTKRPRISTFHTPAAPITYIRVKSTSGVERVLKAALRAGAALHLPHIGNWFVSGFCQLSMSFGVFSVISDVSSGRIRF
jgi:hypothetical protein